VAALGVLALNVVWVVRNVSALRVMGPGQPAPGFDLRTIHGDRVRLSDLRGQVVLIDFWSVTCPPCLESLPHLNEVVEVFSRQPVTVLAIHARGGPRWRALARREATRLGLRFPVLVDDPRGQTSSAYTVRVLPTTVLVGPRGRIRKVWRGATDVESLKAEIRDALEQRSAQHR
jgi:peroxiredoxin